MKREQSFCIHIHIQASTSEFQIEYVVPSMVLAASRKDVVAWVVSAFPESLLYFYEQLKIISVIAPFQSRVYAMCIRIQNWVYVRKVLASSPKIFWSRGGFRFPRAASHSDEMMGGWNLIKAVMQLSSHHSHHMITKWWDAAVFSSVSSYD